MNPNNITPDDPRLTAYALDEMAPAERAEFAQLLQQDTAAQQAVEEIRTTSLLLATALEHEPACAVAKPGVLLRFPQLYYTLSGLAAACFAVVFVLWQNNHKPTQLIEVPLTPVTAGIEAKEAKKADMVASERRDTEAGAAKNEFKLKGEQVTGAVAMDLPVVPSPASIPAVAYRMEQFQVAAKALLPPRSQESAKMTQNRARCIDNSVSQ